MPTAPNMPDIAMTLPRSLIGASCPTRLSDDFIMKPEPQVMITKYGHIAKSSGEVMKPMDE